MLVLLTILTAAHAFAPRVIAETTFTARADGAYGVGLAGRFALPGSGRVAGEGVLHVGATGAGPYTVVRFGGAAWMAPADAASIGATAALGGALDERGINASAWFGFALRSPVTERLRVRVDFGVPVFGLALDGFQLGVGGFLAPRQRPSPEPPVTPTPVVPATAPPVAPPPPPVITMNVEPADALVWIPHPVCAWAPASEAGPLLARYGGDQPLTVRAEGFLPAQVSVPGEPIVLARAPELGAVLVVAWPGDVVTSGGEVFETDPQGVAVVSGPPGPLSVTVTGGGREQTVPAYVGDGHALWIRVSPPEPVSVFFAVGSAVISRANDRKLDALVQAAGEASFSLVGSSSPEGNADQNAALSRRRAEVVRHAFIAHGMPEDRISIGQAVVAEADEAPERQRRVDIVAIGPEGTP